MNFGFYWAKKLISPGADIEFERMRSPYVLLANQHNYSVIKYFDGNKECSITN